MNPSTFVRVILITSLLLIAGVLLDQFAIAALVAVLCCSAIMAANAYREHRFNTWTKNPLRPPSTELGRYHSTATRLYNQLTTSRQRVHTVIDAAQKYKNIANSLPDALVILDDRLEIGFVNQRAAPLLRLSPKDIGKNIGTLIRHPDAQSLFNTDLDSLVGVEIPSPVDREILLELRLFSVGNRATMLLARDVTDVSRLLAMRQDFIANVSHELRTPLTVLLGYLENVLNDELDRHTLMEIVRRLDTPAQRMKSLVDDLLTLTRLEAYPEPELSSLSEIEGRELISAIVEEVQSLATPEHRIVVEAEAGLTVRGVRDELYSALLNLATNAIRYSPNGGEITLKWFQHQGFARFSVHDEGGGISAQHIPRITERFYRVDPTSARVAGGTGLGLAIVKHVLIRHQSSLQIYSKLGQGSTFWCDFLIHNGTEASTSHETS